MSCTNNYIRIHTKFTTQTLKIYHVSLHNFPHSPLTHCPQTQFIIFFKWISHFLTKKTLATYDPQPPYIFNNNYIHKHGMPSFAYCIIIAMDALFTYFQTTVSCAVRMVTTIIVYHTTSIGLPWYTKYITLVINIIFPIHIPPCPHSMQEFFFPLPYYSI